MPSLEDKQNTEYLGLLHQQTSLKFLIPPPVRNIPIKGSLTPYRLHDTYVIDLTLYSDRQVNLTQLQELNPNHNFFSSLHPSLGSTFLFYAELPQPSTDYTSLAKTCIDQLFNQTSSLKLISEKYQLNNCPLIVYDNEEINPKNQQYILTLFNSNQVDIDNQTLERLLNIFWCRHKIINAYHQSRELDKTGRDNYAKIEDKLKKFNDLVKTETRLESLKELLISSFEASLGYSRILRDIQDHKSTIISNQENFRKTLEKLKALPQTNLDFLDKFLDRSEFYIKQIETDLNFLNPGEKILQNLIENIRGIVAIEQLQQDEKSQQQEKNIEYLIAFLGIGLAVSSISSSLNSEAGQKLTQDILNLPICQPNTTPLNRLCLDSINLTFHLLLGLILAVILSPVLLWLFPKIIRLIPFQKK